MIHQLHHLVERPRPLRALIGPPEPSERYLVRARDGVALHLRRVREPGARRGRAVMLLHGLASNHEGFHFPGGLSMARYLARRGYDVWLPELRGHGASRPRRFDWRLDDYLQLDLPAILAGIQRYSGAEEISWVGHSMGGILLMAYGMLYDDHPIDRGVAVGSALDYKVGGSGFAELLALRPVLERMTAIPYGTLIHLLSPAFGRGLRPLEVFNAWPTNIDPEVLRGLHARCFHTIPVTLLSSLATTFDDQGLRLRSGFRFTEETHRIDFPLLLIGGSRDQQVHHEAVAYTGELIGATAQVSIRGADQGDGDHYGHWDLLIGKRAEEEVWAEILEFLES